MKLKLYALVCTLSLLCLCLCSCSQSPENQVQQSTETLIPYVEPLGSWLEEGEGVTLPTEQKDGIGNVDLMGMTGSIEYSKREYVNGLTPYFTERMEWVSHEYMSEEEYDRFAGELKKLFGENPEVDRATYSSYGEKKRTNVYYWRDNNLSSSLATGTIIYFHGAFAYEDDGQARIIFDLSNDPKPNQV